MANGFTLKRALAEGTVIVLSVFLALAADAWWDGRQALSLESQVLAAVASEVVENQQVLRDHLAFVGTMLQRSRRFVASSPAALGALPADSVRPYLEALQRPETFNALTAAAGLLTQTPVLSSDGVQVRAVVSGFLTELEDAGEEREEFRQNSKDVREHLSAYAVRVTDGLGGTMSEMVARLGPSVLAELRADEELVRLVMSRSTIQSLYVLNLQRAGTKLDSVAAVLARHAGR